MLHLAFHHLPLCTGFQNRCVKVISIYWTPASGQYTCHVEYAPARRWGTSFLRAAVARVWSSLSPCVKKWGQVPSNALPFHLKGAVAILWLAAGRPLPSEKTPECTSEEKRHAPDETPTS